MDIYRKIGRYFDSGFARNDVFPWERVYSFVDSDLMNISIVDEISQYFSVKLSYYECSDIKIVTAIVNLQMGKFIIGRSNLNELAKFTAQLQEERQLVNVREGVNYENLNVLSVLKSPDLHFMKVLVKYGVIRSKVSMPAAVEGNWYWVLIRYLKPLAVSRASWDAYTNHSASMLRKLSGSSYKEAEEGEKVKFSRRITVLKLVLCVIELDPSIQGEIIECLRLYFETIAEPFVAIQEIEEWMDIRNLPPDLLDKRRVEESFQKIRRIFPQSAVLQPRSLQHLSRCAAREFLVERGLLPEVIEKINLPKKIKNYLLLKDVMESNFMCCR